MEEVEGDRIMTNRERGGATEGYQEVGKEEHNIDKYELRNMIKTSIVIRLTTFISIHELIF